MDTNIGSQLGNLTNDEGHLAHIPNVWSLVKDRIDSLVDQAIQRTQLHLIYDSKVLEGVNSFKQRLKDLLEGPLKNVAPGHPMGESYHTIHKEVEDVVESAVDEAMHEVNISDFLISNTSLSSVRKKLIITLDYEIELDVFNKVFTNGTYELDSTPDFFHNQPTKDETMFVALVCMAVIIPIIFITLLIIFFYRRQKDTKERRQEMLLEDQPEFSMDEYNNEDRQPSLKVEIPNIDLDLQNLGV